VGRRGGSGMAIRTRHGSEEFLPGQGFVSVPVKVLEDALESVARAILLTYCGREVEKLIGARISPSQRFDELGARYLPVSVRVQLVKHLGQMLADNR
jgi:hypothetical protein